MSVKVIEKSVLSSDRIHELKGVIYLPQGTPKAFLHVVHGMTEHIGRYDGFMREMAEEGYIVFGYDNLGHGKTARSKQELGYIAKKDGWKRLANDVAVFSAAVKSEYGKTLPYYLMGHSMGSFIVRTAAKDYCTPDKLIIMGTAASRRHPGSGLRLSKRLKGLKAKSIFQKPSINSLLAGTTKNSRTKTTREVGFRQKKTRAISIKTTSIATLNSPYPPCATWLRFQDTRTLKSGLKA